MLDGFIQSYGLKAKILNSAVRSNLIKCDFFSCSDSFFIAVRLASDKIDREKLKKASNCDSIKQLHGIGIFEVTGFEEAFLPPISVYGVKVLVDENVMQKRSVHCLLKGEKTLEISPEEIISANEEAETAELV